MSREKTFSMEVSENVVPTPGTPPLTPYIPLRLQDPPALAPPLRRPQPWAVAGPPSRASWPLRASAPAHFHFPGDTHALPSAVSQL